MDIDNENIPIEWQRLIYKYKCIQKLCTKCNSLFLEINNVGSWKCKQHIISNSFEIPASDGKARWPCCGELNIHTNNGCIPADHNAQILPFTVYDDIWLPLSIAPIILKYDHKTKVKSFNAKSLIDISDSNNADVDSQTNYVDKQILGNMIGVRRFDIEMQNNRLKQLEIKYANTLYQQKKQDISLQNDRNAK